MSVPVIAFFDNKGGAGKTSLAYHVAWKMSDLEYRVLAADLDPQANLTTAFVDEPRLEYLWEEDRPATIYSSIAPLVDGTGDIATPSPERVGERLSILAGDLSLSTLEDELSCQWPLCLDGQPRAFQVTSAFWRILQSAAEAHESDVVIMDLGPSLGAINRAALVAADYVVIPLAPNLFSLRGLQTLGPAIRRWRKEWVDRLSRRPQGDLELPSGGMQPLGYVVLLHAVRLNRPVRAYEKWLQRIPFTYASSVAGEPAPVLASLAEDPHLLGLLRHYHSLIPMAQEARKPIFHLKPADGAIGAHLQAVRQIDKEFENLVGEILSRANIRQRARA